jgi:hypothetical protein
VPDRTSHLPSRRLFIGAVPLLFAVAGCSSSDLFTGSDPLGGPPPLAPETVQLESAIAAEQRLIAQYRSAVAAHTADSGGLLASLLSQHEQHLTQLTGRLVVPPGTSASPSPAATATPAASVTVAELRTAEQLSAATLTRQLTGVGPALAQLFASIAASDVTHAAALASAGGR